MVLEERVTTVAEGNHQLARIYLVFMWVGGFHHFCTGRAHGLLPWSRPGHFTDAQTSGEERTVAQPVIHAVTYPVGGGRSLSEPDINKTSAIG